MESVRKIYYNIEEIITCTLFVVMCLAVTIGIVARLLHIQVIWTNDVARYSFMWITFMGASVGIKRKKHIVVDVLVNIFPPKAKRICNIVANIVAIGLFGMLAYYGFTLASNLWYTKMATMPVSMGWVYLSLPVSAVFMILRTVEGMIKLRTAEEEKK